MWNSTVSHRDMVVLRTVILCHVTMNTPFLGILLDSVSKC